MKTTRLDSFGPISASEGKHFFGEREGNTAGFSGQEFKSLKALKFTDWSGERPDKVAHIELD